MSNADYCAGTGPAITLPPPFAASSRGQCGSSLARVFDHGLCVCEDATFTGAFQMDALDSGSSSGGGRPSASVGINEQLITTGQMDIDGSLVVAGRQLAPITSSGFKVTGNFETNSNLAITGTGIAFGRDLWVNGAINVLGFSTVQGDVYQTPGHTTAGMTIGGTLLQRNFQIAEPCACRDDQLIDIAAVVAANTAGANAATVANLSVGERTLKLDCGRFAWGNSWIVGVTTLEAHGRTALFIDGDLTITGEFGVDVGAAGELDVFVRGNLIMTGTGTIGSRARPAAVRIYVGGAGDIVYTGTQRFAANLYAPRSTVVVTGSEEWYGSVFAGAYHATGDQRMHYDAAIQRVGSGDKNCDTPPPPCEVDLDCGSPSVCAAGSCEPLRPD